MTDHSPGPTLKVAKTAFLALVFSLPFVKLRIALGPIHPSATELLALVTGAALVVAVLRDEIRLRGRLLFVILLAFLAVMTASAGMSADPVRSVYHLLVEVYLFALTVIAATLVQTEDDLRRALLAWLGAAAICGAVGTLSILIFYAVGVPPPPWNWGMHYYGTLPAGPYTRIQSTFEYPSSLCNYLTVSLVILLVARHLRWVGKPAFLLLFGLFVVTAVFSVTPGLGGIFLALGVWAFLIMASGARWLALAGGVGAAAAFVASAIIAPEIPSTAPYLITLPVVDITVAPAVRLLTWTDSWHTFLAHPWFGVGVGADVAGVRYVNPQGVPSYLTDAHNVFLKVVGQNGILGIAALLTLIAWVVWRTIPLRLDQQNVVRVGLGLAWLNAFAYQGIVGSFDVERPLWVLLGLFAVAAYSRSSNSKEIIPIRY